MRCARRRAGARGSTADLTIATRRHIVIRIKHSNLDLGFEMTTRSNTPPARGTYTTHRNRQRRRILDAAARLFDERGIDRVTIADIVQAAGIRASTLYEYFANKDDVVWAIVGDQIADAAVRAKQAMDKCETVRVFREQGRRRVGHRRGQIADAAVRAKQAMDKCETALAKITALLEFMADGLANHSSQVRFMAQFDALYARQWSPERLLSLEAQISPDGFKYFSRLIRDGIADGSLRADLSPDLTMHAVINAVIGAQRRLASLSSRVELEYGQPIDPLFRETIRIILLGLRAADPPPAKDRRKRPQSNQQRKRH